MREADNRLVPCHPVQNLIDEDTLREPYFTPYDISLFATSFSASQPSEWEVLLDSEAGPSGEAAASDGWFKEDTSTRPTREPYT